MIYIAALGMLWPVFLLLGCAAVAAGILRYKTVAHFLVGGLFGSFVGYLFAPLVGTLLGSVPKVMIELQYFTQPFYGCIAAWPLFLACMTSIVGVFVGLVGGAYIAFRSRSRA